MRELFWRRAWHCCRSALLRRPPTAEGRRRTYARRDDAPGPRSASRSPTLQPRMAPVVLRWRSSGQPDLQSIARQSLQSSSGANRCRWMGWPCWQRRQRVTIRREAIRYPAGRTGTSSLRVRMAWVPDGAHRPSRSLCVAPAAGRISTRSAAASTLVQARGSRAGRWAQCGSHGDWTLVCTVWPSFHDFGRTICYTYPVPRKVVHPDATGSHSQRRRRLLHTG